LSPEFIITLDSLFAALRERPSSTAPIVGIDGHSTSGKTTLGRALVKWDGRRLFSTDCYARQRREGEAYSDLIELARLRNEIDEASANEPLLLIEGFVYASFLESPTSRHRHSSTASGRRRRACGPTIPITTYRTESRTLI
jgi:hypothetical protein